MYLVGIDEDDIIKGMIYGERYSQTDGFLACYTYFCVAFKIMSNIYIVKTVYVRR